MFSRAGSLSLSLSCRAAALRGGCSMVLRYGSKSCPYNVVYYNNYIQTLRSFFQISRVVNIESSSKSLRLGIKTSQNSEDSDLYLIGHLRYIFSICGQNYTLEWFSEAGSAPIRSAVKFPFDIDVRFFSQLSQKIFFRSIKRKKSKIFQSIYFTSYFSL